MSENTKIEWCNATVNHWAGCTAVSPACDNCYAKRMAGRLWGTEWGNGKPRHQFTRAYETLRALDRKAKRLGRPLRVFHNSLSDFFDNEVPAQWRIGAMRAIVDTPNLIHILLTKRIGNAAAMLEQAFRAVHGQREGWADNVPLNVWLGATICNQSEYDRDIGKLLRTPAAVHFLSVEPMLGPIDMRMGGASMPDYSAHRPLDRMDWVIVGGESGPKARPMHPDWARGLRDQCQAAGVPFLFKQWGEHSMEYDRDRDDSDYRRCDQMARRPGRWINLAGGHGFNGERVHYAENVGKKAAGRHLDGLTWDGYPA